MSAQSAKKKRLGSRRRGANQNEESNAESYRVDSTFVAQHHIPEENVESYAFASHDNSQYETKYPPSPEFSGNRRKLGSSRRLKGKHVKEYATELYHEPREEVEEKTEGMETTTETQKSLAIQPERQEVISQDSATHDGYLCSAITPDNSSEFQNTNTTDSAESLFPQSKHLQADPDKTESKVSDSSELVEAIQEETDRSVTEEVIESTHLVDISELTSLSGFTCQTVEQQLMNQSKVCEMPEENLFTVYPETETECKKRDNRDMYKQDGNFQGNSLVSESHVESVMQFSTTPEITTEQIRPREMTETECSIGQATISSLTEELHTHEEHNQTEDAVIFVHKQEFMPAEVQKMPQIGDSSERLVHAATETENLTLKSSPTELVISNDDKQDEHPTQENNFDSSQHKHEDQHVYDSNESPTSDIERVSTAESHAYETEDRVSCPEATGSKEKEMKEKEFSSQKVALSSSKEKQDEIFNLSDVKSAAQSEDNVNEMHEQELTTTELPQFGYLTDSLIQEAKENPEIASGNVLDPTEDSDEHKSELIVKTDDDPPTNQEMLSDIESVDTTLGQVYETEDQIEDDMKSSAELTGRQEKEGLLSEMMEIESSSLILQSDINAPFDSEPQEDDTVMNPIGNRRKLGSSRRHRGRRHIKDSAAETHRDPSEDIDGNARDNEPLETTEMLTIETAAENKSMETMLEEMDEFDTDQAEDVHDEVREKAHIGTDLHQGSTGDQQTVMQSDFSEMAGENLLNVFAATGEETQERDIDTELFNEILQTNYLVSESHEKSEDVQLSIIPEKTTDKHSSRELPEPEYSIEQAAFSSSKVEMSSNEEQEIFNLSDVKSADQSEDNVKDVPEIASGNVIDPTEDSDEHESELIVKTDDDPPTNQEMFSDIESVDTTLGQVYETEDQIEDDMKSSAELTGHQKKEGLLLEMMEIESSSQTLQSDINAPFDSEPQEDDTVMNPIGNRRKLGSSRRHGGRRHVKDSAAETHHEPSEDIDGNARDNEHLETTEMLTIETAAEDKSMETVLEEMDEFDTAQTEDVRDEVREKAHVGTDLYSSSTVDQKIVDQSDFREMAGQNLFNVFSVTEEENKGRDLQDENLQTKYLVSESHEKSEDKLFSQIPEKTADKHSSRDLTEPEYSIEQAAFSSSKVEMSTKEEQDEIFSLSHVKSADRSKDNVNKVHEQELTTTELPHFGSLTDSLMQEAKENPEIAAGNVLDPTEDSDEHKSELIVKTANDPPTNQEMFSDIESGDTTLGQVYETEDQIEDDKKSRAELTGHQEKEGLLAEMMEIESSSQTLQSDINAPFDSEPQENDTVMNPIGNRRKLGSSRRHRGRRHVKDSAAETHHEPPEDIDGNARDNEPLETTEMLTIETAAEDKSMETVLEEMYEFYTAQTEDVRDEVREKAHIGTDLHQGSTGDQQTVMQSDFSEMAGENLLNVFAATGEETQERDMDTELFLQNEILQTNYLVSESHEKSEDVQLSIIPEKTTDKHSSRELTEPEYSIEQAAFSSSKVEMSSNEEQEIFNLSDVKSADQSEDNVNDVPEIASGNVIDPTEDSDEHESELIVKTDDDPPTNQEMFIDIESVDTTLGQVYETEDQIEDEMKSSAELTGHQKKEGLLSEMMEIESSSQTLQSDINAPFDSEPQEDDTVMNPIGNRRKLGSSRRHRGRRHVKDSAAETHHEPPEDIDGNARDNEPLETTEMLTIETAAEDKSMETVLEEMYEFNTAQAEDVCVKSEDKQFSVTLETPTETSSPRENTGIECNVEQTAFPSSNEDLSSNEEQKEHGNLSHVRTARYSGTAANEVHEEEVNATQMQEMQQINNSSIEDSESPSQALKSEMNAPLDCEPLDNSQSIKEQTRAGFSATGSRRKLGSSRRNKGQLHVKDTTKISLVTETVRQEELNEQTNLDFKPTGEIGRTRSPVNDREMAENMLEDDLTSTQNEMENSNDNENKLVKDPEDLSYLTESDTVKKDGIESTDKSVWQHDSDKIHLDDVEQQEAFQVKNLKAACCDQEDKLQQTNETSQTVGDVMIRDYYKRAESLMCVQVSGQTEERDDHEVHELSVSQEITQAKLFSAAHSKTETLALFNIGPEEIMEAEPAVDVSQEGDIFSQPGIQEKSHLEDGEDLHGKSKQKRRKMGSTRRSLLSGRPGEKNDETEVVEKLPGNLTTEMLQKDTVNLLLSPENKEQQETTETSMVENSSTQEWSTESNMIPAMDYSKTPLPEQSSPHNEVVNPIVFVHVPDVRDSGRNIDAEPLQIDDFTAANTGVKQSMQNEDESSESVHVQQGQAEVSVVADLEIVKSLVRGGAGEEHMSAQAGEQEAENTNEEDLNLNMKNSNSPHRRRKLGSTRRNLGSRSKREDVHQNQEVDDEATTAANVVDVKTETLPGIKEDEPQVPTEQQHNGSEERPEKVFKTMSNIKPVADLTVEENPDSLGELKEPELQPTPSYVPTILSTSPKNDFTSESLSGGRRRKLGSHRKSHGPQNNKTAGAVTDESAKTTDERRDDSLGLDKISKVDKVDRKPSSSTSSSKAGQHSVSEKTHEPVAPVQQPYTKINLGPESHQKISLDNPRGANSYNVMMVGDSSVGKTSFMKRAQSGKFSLDIPASVGLDSCMWNVVVDGRPVVLKLWDTAGQERFHSITKQIFHKAHAFLLMYDITSAQSFSAVSYWASCIQEGAAENVTILLVGNKSDCAERKVKTHEAEILAKEYNFEFVECSAATGENVVQCLETVARMLSQKDDTRQESLVLHKESQQKKSSGCC